MVYFIFVTYAIDVPLHRAECYSYFGFKAQAVMFLLFQAMAWTCTLTVPFALGTHSVAEKHVMVTKPTKRSRHKQSDLVVFGTL